MSHLMLYANCFPVKGAKRSIICDVGRNKYDFIPNSLYELLVSSHRKKLSEIRESVNQSQQATLDSYITFLLEKDYIFFTDDINLFPDIAMQWEHPSVITNAIIDIRAISKHDYGKIFKELDELRCQAIEIRTYDSFDISFIESIITKFAKSGFRCVQLLLKYHNSYNREYIQEIVSKNQRIISIIIHSTIDDELLVKREDNANVLFIRNEIKSEEHCGAISKFNFASNITLFMESHFHNSCLNKKISIDSLGYIKNCPSMAINYGHHPTQTLQSAIDTIGFKKDWDITKDQIDICKDCEFRYICTDCRVYTRGAPNSLAKPAKCTYDPYTSKWSD